MLQRVNFVGKNGLPVVPTVQRRQRKSGSQRLLKTISTDDTCLDTITRLVFLTLKYIS